MAVFSNSTSGGGISASNGFDPIYYFGNNFYQDNKIMRYYFRTNLHHNGAGSNNYVNASRILIDLVGKSPTVFGDASTFGDPFKYGTPTKFFGGSIYDGN